jgi:hypothetical protein
MWWIGVGYRRELAQWIASRPLEVGCLEITAEHFFDDGKEQLCELTKSYPLFVHGLGLSLGTPGPLDQSTLDNFSAVVEAAQPEWISEHVAFTRSDEIDLGHLNPIVPSADTLAVLVDHAIEVAERCGRTLILENITTHLRLDGDLSETKFLNKLCERAGCGLLLDVTNLFINSRNHKFNARRWLRELEPNRIVQLHVVGYSVRNGYWQDLHAEPIQNDLFELICDVLNYAPVRSIIIERDANFPCTDDLIQDLKKLKSACEASRTDNSVGTTSC